MGFSAAMATPMTFDVAPLGGLVKNLDAEGALSTT